MTRHGLVCCYRFLRRYQLVYLDLPPNIRDVQYVAENYTKDEGQDRFGLVFEKGTLEMQEVILQGVERAPEAPYYIYAVQGHSNKCRPGGAPTLEDMLEIPGIRSAMRVVRPADYRPSYFHATFPRHCRPVNHEGLRQGGGKRWTEARAVHLMQTHPRICSDGYKGRAEALCHLDSEVLAILDRTEGMRLYDTGAQCSLVQCDLPWVAGLRIEHRTFGYNLWSRPARLWTSASGIHPRRAAPIQNLSIPQSFPRIRTGELGVSKVSQVPARFVGDSTPA